jgi:hypothetical protein
MEKKRLTYEPPQARDLSAPSVSGQQALYICVPGFVPLPESVCVPGGAAQSQCTTGGFVGMPPPPEECVTGGMAAFQQCLAGSVVGP